MKSYDSQRKINQQSKDHKNSEKKRSSLMRSPTLLIMATSNRSGVAGVGGHQQRTISK